MDVYLATPGSQLHAECMAGCHVLESFAWTAESQWMVRYRPTFAGSMLDSGAYTAMTQGKTIDRSAYIDFCVEHRAGYRKIVNLDVISGDVSTRVDEGLRNLQAMRDAGIDAMPVFHQGEPWSVLTDLAPCGHVGLGFQRPIRCADEFLSECFSRIPMSVKVHGFGMANDKYTGSYPFDSVDSTTWLFELQALSATSGQGSDVLQYLTQGELLQLVLKKYQRMPRATAWRGKTQADLPLFDERAA